MRSFTFLTNNVDINKAPENFIEMFLYQAYLDDNINNVRKRDLRDIKKSLLAELVEFDEETPESHKTWKEKEIDEKMMLEELTDVYFFFSQMINYLYVNNLDIFSNKNDEEKKEVLLILNKEFFIGDCGLTDDKKDLYLELTEEVAKRRFDIQYIMRLLGHFTFLYGYTEEQILESYYRKWKKNIKRIGNEWR